MMSYKEKLEEIISHLQKNKNVECIIAILDITRELNWKYYPDEGRFVGIDEGKGREYCRIVAIYPSSDGVWLNDYYAISKVEVEKGEKKETIEYIPFTTRAYFLIDSSIENFQLVCVEYIWRK